MNERIKELAEKAGFSFKYKTAPDELNPGHRLQDLEKFAELIVQDCANFVREEYDHVDAEGIAWLMEMKYGLHRDYA